MEKHVEISEAPHHLTTTRRIDMTASTLRNRIWSAALLAVALVPLEATLAQSTGDDATLEAMGKCAASAGTATAACGVAGKSVLDFLAKTSEDQAWTAAMSCNDGGAGDVKRNKFVEIRRQAKEWAKNPGHPARISALTKVTPSDKTMCMLNAILGPANCTALLVADRDAFHRNDAKGDPTKGWRAPFCK
jgi:hypothetical protein